MKQFRPQLHNRLAVDSMIVSITFSYTRIVEDRDLKGGVVDCGPTRYILVRT